MARRLKEVGAPAAKLVATGRLPDAGDIEAGRSLAVKSVGRLDAKAAVLLRTRRDELDGKNSSLKNMPVLFAYPDDGSADDPRFTALLQEMREPALRIETIAVRSFEALIERWHPAALKVRAPTPLVPGRRPMIGMAAALAVAGIGAVAFLDRDVLHAVLPHYVAPSDLVRLAGTAVRNPDDAKSGCAALQEAADGAGLGRGPDWAGINRALGACPALQACDRVAGAPFDLQRLGVTAGGGQRREALAANRAVLEQARRDCRVAAETFPDLGRAAFQLARTYQVGGDAELNGKAREQLGIAADRGHPMAMVDRVIAETDMDPAAARVRLTDFARKPETAVYASFRLGLMLACGELQGSGALSSPEVSRDMLDEAYRWIVEAGTRAASGPLGQDGRRQIDAAAQRVRAGLDGGIGGVPGWCAATARHEGG